MGFEVFVVVGVVVVIAIFFVGTDTLNNSKIIFRIVVINLD